MDKILDYINIDENFKYSINIDFDLHKKEKIDGFIATKTSVEILDQMLTEIVSSAGQPQLFIGPYGKGKSHLLLVLLELLSGSNKQQIQKLNEKLIEAKPQIEKQLEVANSRKYIPIIMNGGYENFSRNLILQLRKQLKSYGINGMQIRSYYDLAIEVVERFEIDKQANDVTKQLKKGLLENDPKIYKDFLMFYRRITYGMEFNPSVDLDVISVLKDVETYIKSNTDYDGIIIVLDEFSKFLEGKAAAESLNDIQNIAELVASTSAVQLLCVAHKRIGEYITELDNTEFVNEWKKIEARFKHLYFGLFEDEWYYYSLINEVIYKDKQLYNSQYSRLIEETLHHSESLNLKLHDNYGRTLLSNGVFPLAPYAAFSLVKLSEKIAQNERSLFTFICGTEVRGLRNILKSNPNKLVTVDYIYDYFELLFEENKASAIYKTFIKAKSIISKCKTNEEVKVIKCIAVYIFINDTKSMVTTRENIERGLFDLNVSGSLKRLIDNNLLLEKKSDNSLTFFSGTGVNISSRIDSLIKRKYMNINIAESLNSVLEAYYVLPTAYNHIHKITRFFKYIFVDAEMFLHEGFSVKRYIADVIADGYIIAVIANNLKTSNMAKVHMEKIENNDNIIFQIVLSSEKNSELIKHVYAINDLLEDKKMIKEDEYLKTELGILKSEYTNDLKKYWKSSISESNSTYFYNRDNISIKNNREMSHLISTICEDIYTDYPIVNYELINKHKLTAPILKARRYVIEKILNPEYDISSLRDTSSEKSIYRVLVENAKDTKTLSVDNLNIVLRKIQTLVKTSYKKALPVDEIFLKMTAAPYGIRRGVLPVYLAMVFNLYRHELVITSNSQEVPLSVDALELMAKNPKSFSVAITETSEELSKYVNDLANLFDVAFADDLFVNDYIVVVNGIKRYLNALPDFSTRFLSYYNGESRIDFSEVNQKIISEFRQYKVNSSDLLLKKLPEKYFYGKPLSEVVSAMKNLKNILDNHIRLEKEFLFEQLLEVLCDGYKGSLKEGLAIRLSLLEAEDYKIANDKRLNDLKRISDTYNSHDDQGLLQEISRVMTGITVEDYGSQSMGEIIKHIKEINDLIIGLSKKIISSKEKNQISMIIGDTVLEAYVDNRPLSAISIMTKNELMDIIDESIEDHVDKQNLIMQLLKNYM